MCRLAGYAIWQVVDRAGAGFYGSVRVGNKSSATHGTQDCVCLSLGCAAQILPIVKLEGETGLVNLILWLRKDYSDPALMSGGRLRPLAHGMCATLIMYYPESRAQGESQKICDRSYPTILHLLVQHSLCWVH